MEILPFTPGYAQKVIDLILPIQQTEFNIPIDLEMQPDLRNIPGIYQNRNGNFWIALEGKSVVGTVGLIDIGNNEGALRKMFVHHEYRGSKFGTASLLLQALLEWSFRREMITIYLGTREEFHAAHRFYEKNNFIEVSKSSLPPNFPVMATDNKFYKHSSIKEKLN
jgi:GNAT superfamily N-acetyltransferase